MRRMTIAAVMIVALAVASPASADQPITADAPVQGRLERGDPMRNGEWTDTYTYNGAAGEELRISVNHSVVNMRIDGPGRFSQTEAGEVMAVRLPQSGRYRITASGQSYGAPIAYELSLQRVITEQLPSTLSSGQTIRAGLSLSDARDTEYSRNRVDTYTYQARAGEAVTFHFQGEQTRLIVTVTGANGFSRPAFSDANAARDLNVYFETGGEYRVLVSGEGGNYSLAVQPRQFAANAAPMGRLAIGDSVELSERPGSPISASGAVVNVYAVAVQRGDSISILTSGAGFMRVTDPNGRYSGNQFTARVAGDYRIEVEVPSSGMPPATLQVMSLAQGQAVSAERQARSERELAERNARISDLLRRGDELLNRGDNQAALAAYNEVYPLDPLNVRAQLGAGVAAYRSNNRVAAEMNFTSVLSLDPGNEVATAGLAGIRQTEAAEQRDAQLAYEEEQRQRQAENDQMLSNAIGGFVAGVNMGNAINAANAPPPQSASQQPSPYSTPTTQPTPSAPASGRTPNPANIRYGCVSRSVRNMADGRVLDELVNGCAESELSYGWFDSSGYWNSRVMTRAPVYLTHNAYTHLTICVASSLYRDGPNAYCL